MIQDTIFQAITMLEQLSRSVASWRDTIISNIPGIVISIVVLAIAFLIDGRAQQAVERIVGRRDTQRELARLLGRMARFTVILVALLIVVSIFKLTEVVAAFVASLGIAGLVIAFALQDITKNFAAGVLLLIQRPFRLDDRIKVKEFEGTVLDISLRATALRTADGEEVLLPNADVYTSPIINYTRYPRRRHHVRFKAPERIPIEPLRQHLEAVLRATPGPDPDPAPQVVIVTGATPADGLILDAIYWLPSQSVAITQATSAVAEQLGQALSEFLQEHAPTA